MSSRRWRWRRLVWLAPIDQRMDHPFVLWQLLISHCPRITGARYHAAPGVDERLHVWNVENYWLWISGHLDGIPPLADHHRPYDLALLDGMNLIPASVSGIVDPCSLDYQDIRSGPIRS